MIGSEFRVRFIQGSDDNYAHNQSLYQNGIYFATDAQRLYLNGKKYADSNREIPTADGMLYAFMYLYEDAADIISGVKPNIVQINGTGYSGTGYAVGVYEDADNFRLDAYYADGVGRVSHLYVVVVDGYMSELLDAFEYSYLPFLSESNPTSELHERYQGINEAWIESTGGAITKHYWDGTKYINTLLPTSKNVALETICKYTYSFGSTPTITYGPDSIIAASLFTLERVSLDGIQTQMFCANSWLVKVGKLVTYANGARPMLLLKPDGSELEVGELVKIDCSGADLIDASLTKGFTWDYTDNVYTLTKTYEGRQFIYLNKGMYVTSISYYGAGMSKTFTVSTPAGVREITVLNDPSGVANSITEVNYNNGALYKNYPDGRSALLPTSKDTTTEYLRRYEHSFESTPTISYSSETVTKGGFVLNRVLLDGAPTWLYFPNTWIVRGGRLVTYSNGIRPMVIRNPNRFVLRGEYVKIYTSSSDVVDEVSTIAWNCEYSSGVYTLTYDQLIGDEPIWLNKQKYISKIEYYGEWGVKTFTISTPSGVLNIGVVDRPKNVLDDITALESRFPVGTADISDSSITKEKLAFDITTDISAETVANINSWINKAFS